MDDTKGPGTGPRREADATSEECGTKRRPGVQDRAFVVQIAPDCDAATGSLAGRVQHLATVDGGNFGSVDGLVAILRRVLERLAERDRE